MWKTRRSYEYRNRYGTLVYVPARSYWRPDSSKNSRARVSNRCPYCSARITTVRNANGGWAHLEIGLESYGTLHPCFTRGRGMSKRKAEGMKDLFDATDDGIKTPA